MVPGLLSRYIYRGYEYFKKVVPNSTLSTDNFFKCFAVTDYEVFLITDYPKPHPKPLIFCGTTVGNLWLKVNSTRYHTNATYAPMYRYCIYTAPSNGNK